jgi:hypothetical protein
MNEEERLNLRKMVAANNAEDNTNTIRKLKHSELIRSDVALMLKLKHEYSRLAKSNTAQFDAICVSRCSFLFNNYTDIFNKLKKDEIDLAILMKLVNVLKLIEDGRIDQHEGSFEVGKLLKQIYVDSALRKSEHLDDEAANKSAKKAQQQPVAKVKDVSWKQFKTKIMTPQPQPSSQLQLQPEPEQEPSAKHDININNTDDFEVI